MSARSLGACHRLKGNYNLALEYYFFSLDRYTAIHDKSGASAVLGNIGVAYKNLANYPKALEYEFKALHMAEELKDNYECARHKANIGLVFLNQGDFNKAIEYTTGALQKFQELKEQDGIANCLGGLGNIYGTQGSQAIQQKNYAEAKEYFNKTLDCYGQALTLATGLNEKRDQALYYDNIAVIYKDEALISSDPSEKKRLFKLSLNYHTKALEMNEKLDNKLFIAQNLGNIGLLYKAEASTEKGLHRQLKLTEAEKYLKKAIEIYERVGALNYLNLSEGSISEVYSMLGLHQNAYDHYLKYIQTKDTLFNEENKKKTLRAEMNFEFDKKQAVAKAEREKKEAVAKTLENKEKQKNKIIFISVLSGLLLALVFTGFVLKSYRQKKKINVLITSQKQETERQKLLIEEKQKEILDSIHYARRIQTALLTSEKYIARNLQKFKTD